MFRKVLVITVSLLIFYNLFLAAVPDHPAIGLNQQEINLIQAQRYIYDRKDCPTVIVGSSLAARLEPDDLGPGTYNLAFGGSSIFDGLETIRRSGATPRIVAIETNILMREMNEALIHRLFDSVIARLEHILPSFRPANRPTSVAVGYLTSTTDSGGILDRARQAAVPDSAAFETILAIHRAQHNLPPNRTAGEERMAELREYVTILESRGTSVVFFEMPVHPEITNLPAAIFIRSQYRKHFPPESYYYIEPEPDTPYDTTDGIHLTQEGAAVYARRLGRKLSIRFSP